MSTKKGKARARWETVYEYEKEAADRFLSNVKGYDYRRLLQRKEIRKEEADRDG